MSNCPHHGHNCQSEEWVELSAIYFNSGYESGLEQADREIAFINRLLRALREDWLGKQQDFQINDQPQLASKMTHMALAVSIALTEIQEFEMMRKK